MRPPAGPARPKPGAAHGPLGILHLAWTAWILWIDLEYFWISADPLSGRACWKSLGLAATISSRFFKILEILEIFWYQDFLKSWNSWNLISNLDFWNLFFRGQAKVMIFGWHGSICHGITMAKTSKACRAHLPWFYHGKNLVPSEFSVPLPCKHHGKNPSASKLCVPICHGNTMAKTSAALSFGPICHGNTMANGSTGLDLSVQGWI